MDIPGSFPFQGILTADELRIKSRDIPERNITAYNIKTPVIIGIDRFKRFNINLFFRI